MNPKIKSLSVKFLLCIAFLTSLSMAACAATQTFLYDANGNLINDGSHCYQINAANQLANITDCGANILAQYWYDYTGRKVKAIEGGVTIYYPFPEYEERHYPDGTNETISYFFANGELIARKQKDRQGVTKMFYYHGDHLGSTAVITDEQGNVVERVKYYPYGKVLSRTPQDPLNTRLYNGKEFSGITGLYYYEARPYRPDPPGFIQPDPIIPDVYDPQTLNRYAYAKNNPLRYTDPSGHVPVDTAVDVIFTGYDIVAYGTNPSEENKQNLEWSLAASAVPYVPGRWSKYALKYVPTSWMIKSAKYFPESAKIFGYSDEFVDALRSGENILDVTKSGEKTVWLAEGNAKKGWQHIVTQRGLGTASNQFKVFGDEFKDVDKCKNLVMTAVKEGTYVSDKGGAYLMKVTDTHYIRVGVSSTGEIITAHPERAEDALKVLSTST